MDGFDAWASVPPELRNTDGDLLLLTTDHFRIEPTATPAVEARLATMEEARRLASDEDGKRVYAFVRPDDGQPESRPDTVFGFARVSETSLRLETNSRARADALRARVERACGKQIQYRAREHADPTSDAVVLRPPGPAPATSVPEEALLEFKRRHYRVGYGWVLNDTVRRARHRSRPSIFAREQNMRPFERRDVRQELRGKR